MGTALPRGAAQRFADHLNGVLNATVSDSRLVVAPIPGEPDTFKLTRVVEEDDVPLELDGTTARLLVHEVVVVEDDQCRTESYLYRLQADQSARSTLVRWEYRRDPPRAKYLYPRAHVHVNGTSPTGSRQAPSTSPPRACRWKSVLRNLISDWGVKPRTNDWEAILKESAEAFDHPSH